MTKRFVEFATGVALLLTLGVSSAVAQGWSADQTTRVQRIELGDFDKSPLFQRTLYAGSGDEARYRTEIFWADDIDAYRARLTKPASDAVDLVETEALTIVLTDEGRVGDFPELSQTRLEAKDNRLLLEDWPRPQGELPYANKRVRRYGWDRQKKRFRLEETEVIVPKLERLAALRRATASGKWSEGWRAALALDPYVETEGTPGCDRVVGLATLDLLIAHLDALLTGGRADDAHRVLSLAFKFGGPRAAGCGVTSLGFESKLPAAFATGAVFEVKGACGHSAATTKGGKSGKARCRPESRVDARWSSPARTAQALRSFAEFAAARGDLELVRRLMSGMAEQRFHDASPPEAYARQGQVPLGKWAIAWMWLADDAAGDGLGTLAAGAYRIALNASDNEALSKKERARIEPLAGAFEPQRVDPETIGSTLAELLDDGEVLMAIGEVERYSREDLRAATIDRGMLQAPVIEAVEERLVALKKKSPESEELSDWRALRGKARWLTPMTK